MLSETPTPETKLLESDYVSKQRGNVLANLHFSDGAALHSKSTLEVVRGLFVFSLCKQVSKITILCFADIANDV
jgi:hypothetical protein